VNAAAFEIEKSVRAVLFSLMDRSGECSEFSRSVRPRPWVVDGSIWTSR